MPFFEDREIVHKSESPDGRWHLIIFAPGSEEDEDTYFAEFEQADERRATGIPLGPPHAAGEVKVDWELGGDNQITGIYIDGACYAVFCWREGFIRPREVFRWGDEEPFTAAEIAELTGQG